MSQLESLQNSIETVVLAAEANAHLVDGGSFPTATLEAARQHGLLGLVSSKEVGGLGGGLLEASALVERLARVCGSSAMVARYRVRMGCTTLATNASTCSGARPMYADASKSPSRSNPAKSDSLRRRASRSLGFPSLFTACPAA